MRLENETRRTNVYARARSSAITKQAKINAVLFFVFVLIESDVAPLPVEEWPVEECDAFEEEAPVAVETACCNEEQLSPYLPMGHGTHSAFPVPMEYVSGWQVRQ
jgi:hypothetical protein